MRSTRIRIVRHLNSPVFSYTAPRLILNANMAAGRIPSSFTSANPSRPKMGRWVYYNRTHSESLSGNPFPGGKTASGQPMWVVRTWHQGYLLPGYAVDGTGYFAFEGQVVKKDDFYVFFSDGYNYYFAPSLNQLQTDYWVVGGQTPKNEKLYVGRIRSGFDSSAVGSVLDGVCSAVLLEKEVVETSSDEYGLLQNIFLGGCCDDGN